MAALKFSKLQWLFIKSVVFMLCLSPFLSIFWDAFNDLLGADPIQQLHFRTGDWTLRLLLLSLAMTPLRQVFKSSWPIRFRRMLGLFAFFYASLHLLKPLYYVGFDRLLDAAAVGCYLKFSLDAVIG